jgi:hypothetical protein
LLGEVAFDLRTPLNEKAIRRHIRHALSLGLPEAIGEPETLTIVATGPSARKLPKIPGPTLAVNGALGLIEAPTYYAACDSQELVAGFLAGPPKSTTYYIASKCHPAVFQALRDRDVRLWHVNDYVPGGVGCASSITATALGLFVQMGWRRFEVYGWDCCYGPDGAHHASAQCAPDQAQVNIEIGKRVYRTNTTWAAEAQDAIHIIAMLEFLGVEVVIHGDSMIEAIRKAT